MRKLTKILMGAGVLLLSSTAFVSCSDDGDFPKNTLGPSFIQAITAGTDHVDLQWTITPTDNVEGYLVEIYESTDGTERGLGAKVASQTFEKKVYSNTFRGLNPDTKYVVSTQCIPAAGSKFTKADVAYFLFWTAPIITPTSATAIVTTEKDDNEQEFYRAVITLNWMEPVSIQQVANLSVLPEYFDDEQGKIITLQAVSSPGFTQNLITSTTVTVDNVIPGTEYTLNITPTPSNYCFYTTAKVSPNSINLVMPSPQN